LFKGEIMNILKQCFIAIIMIILLAMPVFAKDILEIDEIDVTIDGKNERGISDTGGIIDNVKPGSRIKIKVNVRNSGDLDDGFVDDVLVTGRLKRIDNSEDLIEEEEMPNLGTKERESETIVFDIPLEVDDDTYELELTVTGENARNGDQRDTAIFDVEIDKDRNEVVISRAELDRTELKCTRQNNVRIEVVNIGEKVDNDVRLVLKSAPLDISYSEEFRLGIFNNDFDDDATKILQIPFTVRNDVKPGRYPITLTILYDDAKEREDKYMDLVIEHCDHFPVPQKEEDSVVLVVSNPPPVTIQRQKITPTVFAEENVQRPGQGSIYIAMLSIICLILLIIVFILLARPRR